MDKGVPPTEAMLREALGQTAGLWKQLADFTCSSSPGATAEWNFSGPKYGWSFRIKDKKRVILYLLPREGYFKAALVFGGKATREVLQSQVSETIKTELSHAKAYAEGRGIRVEVRDSNHLDDLKQLITIKLAS